MGNKKRVAIRITEEALLHSLGLDPKAFSLSRIEHDYAGVLRIVIDGDSLPEIAEGQESPYRTVEQINETIKDIIKINTEASEE